MVVNGSIPGDGIVVISSFPLRTPRTASTDDRAASRSRSTRRAGPTRVLARLTQHHLATDPMEQRHAQLPLQSAIV